MNFKIKINIFKIELFQSFYPLSDKIVDYSEWNNFHYWFFIISDMRIKAAETMKKIDRN